MIPSMASISSSSSSSSPSATVRVEKATSEFLIGPDWTLNMDICDTINSNQMLAKDVVKAVKKRLQHKNPKVQLLALTLLETMVKNCGDYVHFQIAERSILPEMVKIVKKKADMHVRDKILTLVGSWHEAFGGPGGRYPQYYIAYEDLRRSGIQFPQRSPDPVPIFTPPATHPIPRQPQPGFGMPSGSSTRLDEAMAAEESLSLSNLSSVLEVLNLLADMLKAVDPNDRSAIKDEVIIDLVEQCRANQRKLVQSLATTSDEEFLGQGLELNDGLQSVLAKHDAIASGSPLPPEVTNITDGVSEKHDSNVKPAEANVPNTVSKDSTPVPVHPDNRNVIIDEEDEEEDDFALLARRHSKTLINGSANTSECKSDAAHSEGVPSNAIVPVSTTTPASERSKDQDIIDLLSITLSTPISSGQTPETPTSYMPSPGPGQIPSSTSGVPFSSEPYPAVSFNNYVAPWAQPQPKPEYASYPQPQPQMKPEYASYPQPQPQHAEIQPRPEMQYHQPNLHAPAPQAQQQFPQYNYGYPPPPWAATPGYFSNQSSVSRPAYTYTTGRPVSSPNVGPSSHQMSINGELQVNSNARPTPTNAGQKPFIPSYRLFEDLDVFGNTDRRFKAVSNSPPNLLGSNNQNMVGGGK
ncbi:TOM1-like protein 6 [Andrographis paniculata]|uniref:TOM1-like protein 6 n=1 Tax=Andrographis paniculata TaxID=175694 RepID=UPI0021E9A505|nr:TOM1-like protein 6 [Andrographis paniculata]